jgi:hypothetical protein
VQVDDALGPRAGVQPVDVLGDEAADDAEPLERDQRAMSVVRLGAAMCCQPVNARDQYRCCACGPDLKTS